MYLWSHNFCFIVLVWGSLVIQLKYCPVLPSYIKFIIIIIIIIIVIIIIIIIIIKGLIGLKITLVKFTYPKGRSGGFLLYCPIILSCR